MPEIVRITPSQGYVDFLNNNVSNYLTNMIRFDGDASSTPYVVRLTAGVTNPGTSGATFNGATPVMIMTDDGRFGIGISSIPDARLEIASGTTSIGQVKLNAGSLLSSTADGILEYNGTHLYFTIGTTRYQIDQQSGGGGGGTVTSVNMSVPTGFAISGSPVTTSGTLALAFDVGYSLPTTASQTNWDTAFGWGNHASAGYLTSATAATTYQPLDSDLTAIAALTTTSFGRGLLTESSASTLRTTLSLVIGTNVQAWDTDLDAIASLTTTSFGRGLLTESSASTLRSTLSLVIGTNVQAWDADLDAIAALAGTSGLLRKTAANTWSLDTTSYIDNTVTSLSSLTTVGTLTSGTLGTGFVVAGVTMTLGSDATGDIYYRNSSGILTRLGIGSTGQLLTVASGIPSWQTPTTGTVTSVNMSVPTGLTISGNPITTSGTLALTFTAGYSLPTTTSQTNWDTAFGWGNHALAGYLTTATAATTYQPLDSDLTAIAALTTTSFGRGLLTESSASTLRTTLSLVVGTNVQAWDADLDAIAALVGTSGLLKKTAANTWSLDTNTYITSSVTSLSSLTTVGTLTSGSISTGFVVRGVTMTLGSDATGDIYYRNSGGVLTRLDIGSTGQVLTVNTGLPSWQTPTTGTVTSVALSVPTGFAISGSPVTTSGTLALTFTAGYSLPTTTSQSNWDTAFGWGNHASAGYLLASTAATTYQPLDSDLTAIAALTTTSFGRGLLTESSASTLRTTLSLVVGTNVQAWDADLDAIAALVGTSGLLRKTAANTWSLDTTAYIDNNVTTLNSLVTVGTLTSGTLGTGFVVAGVTMTLGSDATGDIYYRNSSGILTRLGIGSTNQVLTVLGGLPTWAAAPSGGGGTVTSVDMSVPTGFAISGNPITSSGTLALAFDTGYSLPTTVSQSNWDTAFSWGNHASAGYLLASTAATTYQPLDSDLTAIAALTTTSFGRGLLTETSASTLRSTLSLVVGTNVQAWDADLDAIAALAGTSGLLRKTATNTWTLDTTAYIDNTVTTLSSLTTVGTLTSGSISTGFVVGGVTMTLGSDATGDIYYRNSGGVLTRLAIGSSGQLLTVSAGLPSWQTVTTTIAIGTTPITSGAVGRIIFEGTGNVAQQNANFAWDNTNTRLGVGLSSPNATLDVKGIGTTSSTSSLIISNSTPTEIFRIYDSRNINIGGSTVTSGTDYKITAFGSGALSSDITLLVSGASSDNIITFHNTPGYTIGGLTVKRSSLSFARNAFSVIGNTTTTFFITSDGTVNLNQNTAAWADYDGHYIQAVTSASHGAGVQGVLYNTYGGGSTASHIFRKGRNTAVPGTGAIVYLYVNLLDSGNTFSNTTPFLKIAPIVNLTGSGTKNIIGIHYAPTITSFTGGGTHVAMLLEAGNSGFGMTTMPTARIHVAAGTATAGTAPIKINSGTNLTTPEDGAMEYNGTHLYFTIGSTRYQLDQQSSSGTVTSVGLSAPTGFTVSGSPVTTTGTLALAFDTGYSLPTTASQTNWNTAFGWGNHASAGYEVALTISTGLTRSTNTITNNLSTGISSGQSVVGGIAASETLTLSSTSHATKGKILFGTSAYDEANNRLGINVSSPTAMIEIASGTTSVGILKISVGSLLTTAVLGTFEYSLVGSNNVLHFTRQGTTRESILTGVSGATAPGTTAATTVNNYYGTAGNVMLGEPATWIQVIDESGVVRKIPAY